MKTKYDLIREKYTNLAFSDNGTIGDLYNAISDDITKELMKLNSLELRKIIKIKRLIPGYYGRLIFNNNITLSLSDMKFKNSLVLLSRAFIIVDSLKYRNLISRVDYLREKIIELSIIEELLKLIYNDNHTDEDLLNSVKTEFMMHQSNLNKKNSKAKELVKIITGRKNKGKELNLILGDEEV